MLREVAVDGLLMPALVPIFFASALLFVAVDLLAGRLGLYRLVWHPGLFRAAAFVILWALIAAAWPEP